MQVRIDKNAAVNDRTLAQAFVLRRCQLCLDASAARRLSRNGDMPGISAKGRDIPLYPAGGALLVQVAEVRRRIRRLPGQLRMRQKAEYIGAVIHRDHHDAAARQPFSIKFHFIGRAHHQPAAKVPHQYRIALPTGHGRGPYVQIQAVLVHGAFGIAQPLLFIQADAAAHMRLLHGHGPKGIA